MKNSAFIEYSAARRAAEKLIGRRGIAAVELWRAGDEDSRRLGDLDAAVQACARRGASRTAARRAGRDWLQALDAWDEARLKVRRSRVPCRYVPHDARATHFRGRRNAARCRDAATLASVLDACRREEVGRTLAAAYTHGGPPTVEWVDSAAECGVRVDYSDEYGGYSRRCKYPRRDWSVMVRAVRLRRDELPGGERAPHGLVTLAAERIDGPPGVDAYAAVWLRRGRGVQWYRCEGVILVQGDDVVHGSSIGPALRSLRRRRWESGHPAGESYRDRANRPIAEGEVAALAATGARIAWSHARRAGLCEDGIRAWCAEHYPDLDPETDSVPVADALAVGGRDHRLVVAAARIAARRVPQGGAA